MTYQDHLTKCVFLRALTSKRPAQLALHFLAVFFLRSRCPPPILHSDNGQEFVNELKEMRIDVNGVEDGPRLHYSPRYSHSEVLYRCKFFISILKIIFVNNIVLAPFFITLKHKLCHASYTILLKHLVCITLAMTVLHC